MNNQIELPWLEKYRPKRLDEIVGNEQTIARFKAIVNHGNLPNIILSGPPGIGKTTTITCLANELLGGNAELIKEAVLELNASDDRGIDTVRNKIKMFAMKKVNLPQGRHKIVVLDEADSMTAGAQQALRRIMEIYSNTTRFALACNTSSKIIEPIQSRCAIVRFGKLPDEQVLIKIIQICKEESIQYTTEGVEAIMFTADGDMRQAINNLQATSAAFDGKIVSAEDVYKICDLPNPALLQHILECCTNGQMEDAFSGLYGVWNDGFSPVDIITSFFRVLKYSTKFPEHIQLTLMKEVGMTHVRLLDGSSSLLQLTGMLANMCEASLGIKIC